MNSQKQTTRGTKRLRVLMHTAYGGLGGPTSLEVDPVHFRGQEDDPVSEPNYILHWDIETSFGMPGNWNGHMIMLNVAQKDAVVVNQVNYPGQDYLLPNYQYVQSQGGIVGYAHVQNWTPGSYSLNRTAQTELPLDVALARVDFLGAEQMEDGLYWIWYSMFNAGFHFPVLGVSDGVGCWWQVIGQYHAAFPLPTGDPLTYTKFIEAVRENRTVIRRNNSPPDYLDIRVNSMGLGGELTLPTKTVPALQSIATLPSPSCAICSQTSFASSTFCLTSAVLVPNSPSETPAS